MFARRHYAAKLALVATVAFSTAGVVSTFSANAQNTKTTIHHPDGSKEVITPDGRRSFYNFDGSPRGINRTCSNRGGLIVTCSNWGSNSYGGR